MLRNDDGTATVIDGNRVVVQNADGTRKSTTTVTPPDKINPDGSITKKDGTIVNPDGTTERKDVDLPNGTKEKPNGGETLVANKAAGGKSPLNPDGSLPAGAGKNTDGTIKLQDGTILNPDGTVRTPAPEVRPNGGVIDPDAAKSPAGPLGVSG